MIKRIINIISGVLIPICMMCIIMDLTEENASTKELLIVLIPLLIVYLATGADRKYRSLRVWERILRFFMLPLTLLIAFMAIVTLGLHYFFYGVLFAAIAGFLIWLYVKLFEPFKHIPEIVDIDSMDGYEFEHYCAKLLSKNGYSNVQVTSASGDYGADIIAHKKGEKWVVQCKRYGSPLGNSPIQEVVAAMKHYGAQRAAVMTNSIFTKNAVILARSNGVLLIDGADMRRMMM